MSDDPTLSGGNPRRRSLAPALLAFMGAFVLTAGATHAYTLFATPGWQTDKQIAAGLKMGRTMNTLNHSPPPRAERW